MQDNDGHGIKFVFKGLDYTTLTAMRTNVLMVRNYFTEKKAFWFVDYSIIL